MSALNRSVSFAPSLARPFVNAKHHWKKNSEHTDIILSIAHSIETECVIADFWVRCANGFDSDITRTMAAPPKVCLCICDNDGGGFGGFGGSDALPISSVINHRDKFNYQDVVHAIRRKGVWIWNSESNIIHIPYMHADYFNLFCTHRRNGFWPRILSRIRMPTSDNNWRVVAIQIEIDENLLTAAGAHSFTHSIWNIQNDNERNRRKKMCLFSWW